MEKYIIIKTSDLDINKINNTYDCGGRFGNIFIRNFVAEYIAKKNNLKVTYEKYNDFKKLGINLFIGKKTYYETLLLNDENIDSIIFDDKIFKKYALNKNFLFRQVNYNPLNSYDYAWCQTSSIVSHIRNYVNFENRIFNKNPYKSRYNNNNDLFIHVRLGDIIEFKFEVDYKYYDETIIKIKNSNPYKKAYITSDSIDHDICKKLIKQYNLIIYNSNEIDTLQFGSTCKSIVLSNGTFSWLLGLLSFKSNVHYPTIKTKWHGNIFVYPDWHEISY